MDESVTNFKFRGLFEFFDFESPFGIGQSNFWQFVRHKTKQEDLGQIAQREIKTLDPKLAKFFASCPHPQVHRHSISDDYILHTVITSRKGMNLVEVQKKSTPSVSSIVQIFKNEPYVWQQIDLQCLMSDKPQFCKITSIFTNRSFANLYHIAILNDLREPLMNSHRPENEVEVSAVIVEVGNAIKYLHDLDIVHLNVSAYNIFYSWNGSIKLVGFSTAKKFIVNDDVYVPCCEHHVQVEQIHNHLDYSKSVDMWSLGALMFILLCGRGPFFQNLRPYSDRNSIALKINLQPHYEVPLITPVWDFISQNAQTILIKLLAYIPLERISINDFLIHEWIVDNGDLEYRIPLLTENQYPSGFCEDLDKISDVLAAMRKIGEEEEGNNLLKSNRIITLENEHLFLKNCA